MSDKFVSQAQQFQSRGWLKFGFDDDVRSWADHALPTAERCLNNDQHRHWWRYRRTWFVGVNVLPNDRHGNLENGPPLNGDVLRFMRRYFDTDLNDLDAGQVSAVFPGYPKPNHSEDEPGFAYRVKREAAHVDGLLKLGDQGERFLKEPHQYILAIPLNAVAASGSPLVLWSGSHHLMRQNFKVFFEAFEVKFWADTPVNSVYEDTRRTIFDQCERVEVPLVPGEALLLDRHLLHGTSVWRAENHQNGRLIAFFRPQFTEFSDWLNERSSIYSSESPAGKLSLNS